MNFNYNSINIDPESEVQRITFEIKEALKGRLKKRGAIVGISGGIDSSVVLALAVKALGADKVIGVMMPEKDSTSDSLLLATILAEKFGVATYLEELSGALAGFGCYEKRDEAVRRIFPNFDSSWKMKIVLPKGGDEVKRLNLFNINVVAPDGSEFTERLPLKEYLQIVAASNFKQRSRMTMLYYHAESNNYAVLGTGNKNEHEMGFFVKYGDGGADIKPIAHLLKTQVYQLAEYLEVPDEIRSRIPTTDTYSAGQTQEEFFFQVPFDSMDRVWYAMERNVSAEETASALKLTVKQVEAIQENIRQKIRGTEYLRIEPIEIEQNQNNLEIAL
jgi:NAD+ synthase